MQDVELECVDCHKKFVWSVSEQQFFKEKGLKFAPKRCMPCRHAKKKAERNS